MRKFSVSEVRSATACPRVFYFDERRFLESGTSTKKLTQIWTDSDTDTTACGKLFHTTIERFSKLAAAAPEILSALQKIQELPQEEGDRELVKHFMAFATGQCLNRRELAKKDPQQAQNFIAAIERYFKELAMLIGYAVRSGRKPAELVDELFGDTRKRVDVTFRVGRDDGEINVRGNLDHIFYDYRHESYRILDFKLAPATNSSRDLTQIAMYALMHDRQHGTKPDTLLMYLHPQRKPVEQKWEYIFAQRHVVDDLLASMEAWTEYDESTGQGLKPPGSPGLCSGCRWNRDGECEQRLGPKNTGNYSDRWSKAAQAKLADPTITKHDPPRELEIPEAIEEEDSEVSPPVPKPASASSKKSTPSTAKTSLPYTSQPDHLHLGQTAAGKPVTIPLSALATHVGVLGAAGSGKSWLAKILVEEAAAQGVPILAIDPQGDLAQFLLPANLPADAPANVREVAAKFRARIDVRLWTPGSSHARRLSLSPLKLPSADEFASISDEQRRQEEREAVLTICAANLVRLADASGDELSQQTFLLEILRNLAATVGQAEVDLKRIIAAISEPEAFGVDDPDSLLSKRDRDKLKQRLNAQLRGPTANLFRDGTPLDLSDFTALSADGRTPLNVVYLNALPNDEQKQFFVASLAMEVYRWMIATPSTGRVRLLVFLDEAKDFLPAGTAKPPAKEPLIRLFSQGRKFGVGCLICTQSPRSVDYNIFSNASTKLIGRLEAAQDVDRVKDWFRDGDGAPAWLAGRVGAAKGSWCGRWPEMECELAESEFQTRQLYSLHEGAWSPDRVEAEWRKRI